MKRHHRVAAAVLALIGSASASAAGPLVVQGSSSISDLQLIVSDFRPDDGIAAQAALVNRGSGKLNANCCDYGFNTFDARILNINGDSLTQASTARVSMLGGQVGAKRTADGAQAQIGIDKDQFESTQIYSGKWESNSVGSDASVSLQGYRLELAAGTEIRLSGVTTADAWVDMTQQQVQGGQYQAVLTKVVASSSVNVNPVGASSSFEFLAQPVGGEAFAGGEVSQTRQQGNIVSSDPTQLRESTSFLYVIRNVSAQSQFIDLSLKTRVFASTYNVSGVSAVPEPEAWALLLGGLLGVGALVRRRRAGALLCASVLLAPLAAQAAPVVSAEGSMFSSDAKGEAEASYRIDPQTQPFHGSTDSYFPSEYGSAFYFGRTQAGAQSYHESDGRLRVFVGAQNGSFQPTAAKAAAQLEWTDVVSSDAASPAVATLSFTTFQQSFVSVLFLGRENHFKASVWLDGQSDQPLWYSGLDTVTNASGGTSTVLSGADIGLSDWGGGAYGISAKDVQINLGYLSAGQSRTVHFKIEMSMDGGYYDSGLFLETSAPLLAVTAVPEPSAWLMGLFGAVACAGLTRRARPQL